MFLITDKVRTIIKNVTYYNFFKELKKFKEVCSEKI